MTAVAVERGPVRGVATERAAATGGAVGPAATLPPPMLNEGEAIVLVMRLVAELNETSLVTGTASAKAASADRQQATTKLVDALKRAVEAQEKARRAREGGGIFAKITKHLGPVGLIGLCVGSFYVAAADYAMHATGLMRNKADLTDFVAAGGMCTGMIGIGMFAAELAVKRLGPDALQRTLDKLPTVDDSEVQKANKIALLVYEAEVAIAVTVGSLGTATPGAIACIGIGISTATQIAQETGGLDAVFGENAKWVALGGAAVGLAAGAGGTALASTQTSAAIGAASALVNGAQGAVKIADGVEQIAAAHAQHDADEKSIDATRQRQLLDALARTVDALVEELHQTQQHAAKSIELGAAIGETNQQTSVAAATWRA